MSIHFVDAVRNVFTSSSAGPQKPANSMHLRMASRQLSDDNLRNDVDHIAQLAFMRKTAAVVVIGGGLCLVATLAFSKTGLSPNSTAYKVDDKMKLWIR